MYRSKPWPGSLSCRAARCDRSPHERIILLFCHGGSLHQACWTAIIRRLQQSAQLQHVPYDVATFDWRHHGVNACDEDPATLFYESGDQRQPRVAHPAVHWPTWATEQLVETVASLQHDDHTRSRTTRIIGIGHSMGAATLLNVEVLYPGSFAGLVLFEPTFSFEARLYGGVRWAASFVVASTLAREDTWDSKEAAIAYIKNAKVYSRWHPESLDAFIHGGVRTSSDGTGSNTTYRLATPLLHESALYCHDITNDTRQQLARVACPVVFEYGTSTVIFNVFAIRTLVDTLPTQFTLDEPMDKISHQAIMEAPDLCAQRIATQLATFPVVQQHAVRTTSRL